MFRFTHVDFADPSTDPALAPAKEEEETAGGHVFRYLRAIVAWVNASLSLSQHEVFKSEVPVELYVVHVPPSSLSPASSPPAAFSSVSSSHTPKSPLLGSSPFTNHAVDSTRLTALPSVRADVLGRLSAESAEAERASAFFEAEEHRLVAQGPGRGHGHGQGWGGHTRGHSEGGDDELPTFEGSVHTECALLGVLAGGSGARSSGGQITSEALRSLFTNGGGQPLGSLSEIFQVRPLFNCPHSGD